MSTRPPPEGLDQFYVATWPRLVVLLTVVTGSRATAEEVAQDAFVRLVPRWAKVSAYDAPEAWLRHVALRLVSTRRRDHARRGPVVELPVDLPDELGLPAPAPDREAHLDLAAAVATLPMHQRQVVALFYLADLSVDEVAATLRISAGTVKSRLSRARTALAQHLDLTPESRTDDAEDRYV